MRCATSSIISTTRHFQLKENILRWPLFRHILHKGMLHSSKPVYRTLALESSKLISCNSQFKILKLDLTLQIRLSSSINLSLIIRSSRTSKGWSRQTSSIQMLSAMVPQFSIAIRTTQASYRRTNNSKELPKRAQIKSSTMLDRTSQTVMRRKRIKLVTTRRWSTPHQK